MAGLTAGSTRYLKSTDGLAWTMVWQCSEGMFNWYYDVDETILILEGSIVLESDTMSRTRYLPGDVIYFKDGAHAKWHVEGHVRKLAFFRRTQPVLLAFRVAGILQDQENGHAGPKRRVVSLMDPH